MVPARVQNPVGYNLEVRVGGCLEVPARVQNPVGYNFNLCCTTFGWFRPEYKTQLATISIGQLSSLSGFRPEYKTQLATIDRS